MITQNTRQFDKEDAAVLFSAVVLFDHDNGERDEPFDVSIARVGYADMFERCHLAATIIATVHVEEGEEWDGVVWYEMLAEFDDDSLGACLLHKLHECELDAEGVRDVTLAWLENVGGSINV